MLQMILPEGSSSLLAFFGILFAFSATVLATAKLSPYQYAYPQMQVGTGGDERSARLPADEHQKWQHAVPPVA